MYEFLKEERCCKRDLRSFAYAKTESLLNASLAFQKSFLVPFSYCTLIM